DVLERIVGRSRGSGPADPRTRQQQNREHSRRAHDDKLCSTIHNFPTAPRPCDHYIYSLDALKAQSVLLFPAHTVAETGDVRRVVLAVPRIERDVGSQAHQSDLGVAEAAVEIGGREGI